MEIYGAASLTEILETVTWIVLVSSAYDSWLVAARKHPRAYPAMRLKQGVYLAKTGFKFEPVIT